MKLGQRWPWQAGSSLASQSQPGQSYVCTYLESLNKEFSLFCTETYNL